MAKIVDTQSQYTHHDKTSHEEIHGIFKTVRAADIFETRFIVNRQVDRKRATGRDSSRGAAIKKIA